MKRTLLLGTRRGLFMATKESGHWRVSNPMLLGQPIFCAGADSRNGVKLLAGRNDVPSGPAGEQLQRYPARRVRD